MKIPLPKHLPPTVPVEGAELVVVFGGPDLETPPLRLIYLFWRIPM